MNNILCFQTEGFGNSFVLESLISEEVKKDISQAVSIARILVPM